MAQNPIQWFPGHMAKTRRVMRECMSQVDVVLEVLDARIPYSSQNPETESMTGQKPKITVLSKSALADPDVTRAWIRHFDSLGVPAVAIDSVGNAGMTALEDKIREVLTEKTARYAEKGMEGRRLKAMIVGIPNVGKSSLINRLSGSKKAKVEDRPGVTLEKQWVPTSIGLDLLDMPGVLWPKFEDETVGQNLALTGAINDRILDTEELAMILCDRLRGVCPDTFYRRYKLDAASCDTLSPYELFEAVGRKRGFLVSGGEVNTERTAVMLLDEFRGGLIGRISLEKPNL